jgi:cardiolipin synthase
MVMPGASPLPITSPPIRAEIAGNVIEVIESGADRLHALLALITGATTSIKMLMYMFNPDHAGGVVHDALLAAARRGVEVKLLIDGFGSDAPPRFFADLAAAGGDYCVFNPSFGRRYLLRNHQKLITADDRAAIIGGANIDNS